MYVINCLGDVCPIPIMRFQKQEKRLNRNETLQLITDHSCVVESLRDYCSKKNYHIVIVEPVNGVWELNVSKD